MYIVCVDAGVIYVYVHAYILNIHAYCCVFVGAHDYVCSYLCIYIYIHTHLHMLYMISTFLLGCDQMYNFDLLIYRGSQIASARAANHRLQRGIWTSPSFGDMRRALSGITIYENATRHMIEIHSSPFL